MPSSTAQDASADMMRKDGSGRTPQFNAPPKSARRRAPVDGMDRLPACPLRPQEQKQKKRTNYGLPKPDNFIRYRQKLSALISLAGLILQVRQDGHAVPDMIRGS
jgi:hypothetical protein